ncbi:MULTISPECIES: hypothetical protein [Bacillus]|uniref:hypothetical protein n=1 Tax=Bacillus TaxID=1386 RepID=UPI0002FECBB1|nr:MULTISPECIES: hypothetical protein [Bacillus]
MLQDKLLKYIELNISKQEDSNPTSIELYSIEKDYVLNHQLMCEIGHDEMKLIELDDNTRFLESYMERCDKESENFLSEEGKSFLQEPISYFKQNKKEFLYTESIWWEMVNVESVSLEVDDVFGTYNIMIGLKLPKKWETQIKEYLSSNLHGDAPMFGLIFSQNDGLWDLNITLDYMKDFKEDLSIAGALTLIYKFMFNLIEFLETNK